jgi:7-cyano-7-deazaguanine reductase
MPLLSDCWRYARMMLIQCGKDLENAMSDGDLQLGREAKIPARPEQAVLDRIPNPRPGVAYLVRFTCPEFTTLCPITGQPDFAHIVVDYVPGEWLIESKSLKLLLFSYRNHGCFHEETTLDIGRRIAERTQPIWIRVGGYWYPRGGIPVDVFWQEGTAPKDLWIPDQGVPPYRGRG